MLPLRDNRWLPLAVLVALLHGSPANAGLFMKRGKPRVDANDEEEVCVNPKALLKVEETLVSTESARDLALSEKAQALEEAEQLKLKLQQHKEDTQTRLGQLEHASESAHKVAQAQEDFAKRMEAAQIAAEKELSAAKATIADKEQALKDLKTEYEKQTTALKLAAELSTKEAEAQVKASLASVEVSTQEKIQKIQSDLEAKLLKATQETAILMGEKRALEASFEKMEGKYEHMLRDQEEALALYMKEKLDSEVAKITGEATTELSAELTSLKEQCESTINKLTVELDETSSRLARDEKALLSVTTDYSELKEESRKSLAEAHELLERTIAEHKNSSSSSVKMAKEKGKVALAELKAASEKKLAEANAESERVLEELRAQSRKELEKSQQTLAECQASSEKELAETKKMAEQALQELKEQSRVDFEKMVTQLTTSAEQQEKLLMEKLTKVQKNERGLLTANKKQAAEIKAWDAKLEKALEEARHWSDLYDRRSYFNLTHVATDAVDLAAKTKKATTETLTQVATAAAEPVKRKTRALYNSAAAGYDSHVVPSAVKSRALFDSHVQPHVNVAAKHAHPIYHQYMRPHVQKVMAAATEGIAEMRVRRNAMFADMVELFETACPSAMSTLTDVEKKTGVTLPASLFESTQYSCIHGEESVSAFLKFVKIIVLIILRRRLWNIAWGAISLVLAVVWFVSPLRILFFRKTRKKPVEGKPGLSKTNGSQRKKVPQNGN